MPEPRGAPPGVAIPARENNAFRRASTCRLTTPAARCNRRVLRGSIDWRARPLRSRAKRRASRHSVSHGSGRRPASTHSPRTIERGTTAPSPAATRPLVERYFPRASSESEWSLRADTKGPVWNFGEHLVTIGKTSVYTTPASPIRTKRRRDSLRAVALVIQAPNDSPIQRRNHRAVRTTLDLHV